MDWRMEWQTTSAFLPWEPHEQYNTLLWYICGCNMIANIVRIIRYDNLELWELLKNLCQLILAEALSIQGKTSVIPAK